MNPGDEVILQGPNWPDYMRQIDMVNAKAVFAKVDESCDFKMTADIIEPLITEKTHVVTAPGDALGPHEEGYIRICYASKHENIKEALERMEKAFGTY